MYLKNSGKFVKDKTKNFKNFAEQKEDPSELGFKKAVENDEIDHKYGFDRISDHLERTGFLLNMHTNEILDEDKRLISAVDYFFMQEDGTRFKATLPFSPYFYILAHKEAIQEVTQYLAKKYLGLISKIETIVKEDLDLPNHLIGLKQRYLKLSFKSMNDLIKVKREIMPTIKKNREYAKTNTYYTKMLAETLSNTESKTTKKSHQLDNVIDIREYDVPYHVRVSIDKKIFCGSWYTVQGRGTEPPIITKRDDLIERPEPIVLAFDIETTKLPLKFPDAATDQIMMISYMIDGQGFLITNREIVSADVDDFEYTPRPELEGEFKVYNAVNETQLLRHFFDHIINIRPHVFVTYNGDFFDWPFVEARAAIYGMNMATEIGVSKSNDGLYLCRPAIHMDCLCWVKRDSYLPVGSQNLKAVAKAKLRYDPVELDPEDMCALAVEKPQILSNYSVSDAVATYYLYMKYIHPFVFALCTIIPMEPDEVLRKGSGTLCETLLMVEAFHANIVFPNKQETEMTNWSTDGHILEQETYVGGHVEALESGVFRADIPCRFRLDPEGIDVLADNAEQTLRRAIEEENKVPLNSVTNFEEAVNGVRSKLDELKKHPNRIEAPVIYHLDVGAMYPNIILTNRLQPSAMVDETVCAACDFNRSGARCQRNMEWMWRGDMLPATRGEYQRILQQLETEKFPPAFPGGPHRAFHQLSREDQTTNERSRLKEYCRKAYRKLKVTRTEERTTTICQMENSFYVDTVRAFRDRRYEYKGLSKKSKQEVNEAVKKGNAEEIRSAKNREVLYDSLQLAHKCILNSFYGYVMRRGARWHSMEMAGIVCHTGAHIIMKARQIIEQIGRPLELDTDGIWCVLPASFPETITIERQDGRPLEISYANAVLNAMVQDYFTNDQYHELLDAETLDYKVRSENSIFFEVDGPYRAMVLPASKEEGKKLKKRYAVFDFDGSLAELKGFEVKRRGELKLIKIFQGSVFGAFLKGSTLEECYDEVARVADYWLDVLYSRGANMPDSELFDLISENRSMSRKLEDYGAQKSTSISTAKRLAEFLGDQMVKDKGLACKFIISRKPDGAPVTERAIPLAIFQTEPGTKRHFLRKWLKDSSLIDLDIRDVLDWNYYIERLGSTIQKIITIPAALQGIANPVPRIKHPPWLHKKILEKNDVFKQRSITEMFAKKPKQNEINTENIENTNDCPDIEDMGQSKSPKNKQPSLTVTKRKRSDDTENSDLTKSWREVLGPPPPMGKTKKELQAWIVYQKKKWKLQAQQRGHVASSKNKNKRARHNENTAPEGMGVVRSTTTLSGFLRKAQRSLLELPWQAIQISETREPGVMKLWVLVGQELHQLKITVPRVFYVNQRTERAERTGEVIRKCNRVLPRSRPVYNLYQVTLPENVYQEHSQRLLSDFSSPGMEGIYETQMSPLFRALMQLGCVCGVKREFIREMVTRGNVPNVFSLDQLSIRSLEAQPYLQSNDLRHIYLYHHKAVSDQRAMFGLFLSPTKRAYVFVLDSVRTNQMPNMNNMYNTERNAKKERGKEEDLLPPSDITFEIRVETDPRQVFRLLQRTLLGYLNEKRGPSLIAIQSPLETDELISHIPALTDLPNVEIHVQDIENLYGTLDWQRVGAKAMVRHYLNSESVLEILAAQCRYFYVPIGNVPSDPTIFSADLYFARYLQKHNFVLWCSPTEKPDLGGWEADDNRLLMDIEEGSSAVANKSGCYSTVCVELDIDGLAVNTLLQSHKIHDTEEASFNAPPSLDQLIGGVATTGPLPTYDETSPCAAAFKVLRSVVSAWLRDISVHRNVFADFQVVHFYRWLRSAKSLLYEPAIRRTLLGLMKKLFVQLIAELTRLGVTVVYADFNKIVLCTKKHTIEDAVAYVEFIVRSVRNKELFHSIELSYSQCWEYLVWLDAGNHAGVKGKLPSEETQATEEEQDDKSQIIMNWSLIENLPEEGGCRASFNAVIAGFISAVHTHIYENVEDRTGTPLPRRPNTSMSMSMTQPLGLAAHSTAAEFAKQLITGEMSMKLFEITQKIHARAPECKVPEGLPGAKSKIIHPALEFVKAVCHILSLDKSVTDEITSLRSNMLRLVGVGEFSDESVWVDPFVSFVLPEVICNACNHCRDIDLIKDLNKSTEDDDKSVWLCTVCKTSYENDEIEHQLIDALNRKAMAYMLQDLQCTKCSQIKRENMPQYCSCAGTFQTLVSRQSILDHLNTFKMVAKSFKMPLLLETAEWFLQNTN